MDSQVQNNVSDRRAIIASFRQRLLEDPQFRVQFAANPQQTLTAAGLEVPPGTVIAPMDVAELDQRVASVKAALGDQVSLLCNPDEYDKLSEHPEQVLQLQEIMRPAGVPDGGTVAAVAGGRLAGGTGASGELGVFRISVASSIDW